MSYGYEIKKIWDELAWKCGMASGLRTNCTGQSISAQPVSWQNPGYGIGYGIGYVTGYDPGYGTTEKIEVQCASVSMTLLKSWNKTIWKLRSAHYFNNKTWRDGPVGRPDSSPANVAPQGVSTCEAISSWQWHPGSNSGAMQFAGHGMKKEIPFDDQIWQWKIPHV